MTSSLPSFFCIGIFSYILAFYKPIFQVYEHRRMIKSNTAEIVPLNTVLIGNIKPVIHRIVPNKSNTLWYYSVSQYGKKSINIQLFNAYEGNRPEYFALGIRNPQVFYYPEANGRGQ